MCPFDGQARRFVARSLHAPLFGTGKNILTRAGPPVGNVFGACGGGCENIEGTGSCSALGTGAYRCAECAAPNRSLSP